MACNIRGIGWDFGSKSNIKLPDSTIDISTRSSLLWAITKRLPVTLGLMDVLAAFLKSIPGVGTPQGGSIFLPDLPLVARYALSTAAHVAIGMSIALGTSLLYDILTVIGVVALRMPPSDFPPMVGKPWRATSLHDLWSVQWHQVMHSTKRLPST